MSKRDDLRLNFAATMRPQDVTISEIYRLWDIIDERLSHPDEEISGRLKMKLQPLNDKVMGAIRRHGWPSRGIEIKVDGPYFTGREGITFSTSGFIGFCGWVSGNNSAPFADGFDEWVRTFARHHIQAEEGRAA